MYTYFDRLEDEKKEYEKFTRMVTILGRDNQLPSTFENAIVKTPNDNPKDVLKRAGYINIGRGWVYKIKGGRYHAYIHEKSIYIHKDENIKGGRHKATTRGLREEKKRIKSFKSDPPDNIPKKKKEVYADLKSIVYPENILVKRPSLFEKIISNIFK